MLGVTEVTGQPVCSSSSAYRNWPLIMLLVLQERATPLCRPGESMGTAWGQHPSILLPDHGPGAGSALPQPVFGLRGSSLVISCAW